MFNSFFYASQNKNIPGGIWWLDGARALASYPAGLLCSMCSFGLREQFVFDICIPACKMGKNAGHVHSLSEYHFHTPLTRTSQLYLDAEETETTPSAIICVKLNIERVKKKMWVTSIVF